jgi:hypothetical protein
MQKMIVTAHQLAIGMTLRCPLEGDEITISDLGVISEKSIGFGCEKGYITFDISKEFELVKPYDLIKYNPNWVREQLEEQYEMEQWIR